LPIELGRGAVLIDRFEIEELVAQGGMGVVCRARDRRTQRQVAVKLVTLSNEAGRARRFARESRLLAGFDHPRIAQYVAHGETDEGQAFLAMEWLDGADLADVLAGGPLSLADSLRVLIGAAEALAAVHEKGIVHRDLKPSNLFLRGRSADELVLLDFGIARGVEGASLITATATLVGSRTTLFGEQRALCVSLRPLSNKASELLVKGALGEDIGAVAIEALLRATRGIECGAVGQDLGSLEYMQSAAFFSMGRWTDCAEVGLKALQLLPRGGAYWCRTVENLMQVLPNVGAFESCEDLARELRAVTPAADARPAYLRALCTQLLGYAISGSHERGDACLALIDPY